jgi:hypothetical protein
MSLRRRVEEALMAQFLANERMLTDASAGEPDPALMEKYQAYRAYLKPIVAEIVVDRETAPGSD